MSRITFSVINILCLAFLFFITDSFAIKSETIPDIKLEVAYRKLTEGKLSKSVHNIILSCYDGQCEMTTLTLNQCVDFPVGNAFYPKIERTSTREGNLLLRIPEKGVIEAEERIMFDGSFTAKYRFTYDTSDKSDKFILKDLTGFSGAVVKQSNFLNKVISWDLVPLKGQSVNVKADCDINLIGIRQN